MQISGPVSVDYLENKTTFLMFLGDYHHSKAGACPEESTDRILSICDLVEYISLVFPEDNIDFYLEMSYLPDKIFAKHFSHEAPRELYTYRSKISEFCPTLIPSDFVHGFLKDTQICLESYFGNPEAGLSNVRYHAIDIRADKFYFKKHMQDDLFFLYFVSNFLIEKVKSELGSGEEILFHDIIEHITYIGHTKEHPLYRCVNYRNKIWDTLLRSLETEYVERFDHPLSHLLNLKESPNWSVTLGYYYSTLSHPKIIKQVEQAVKWTDQETLGRLTETLFDLDQRIVDLPLAINHLLRIFSRVMDIYTLFRMLRPFGHKTSRSLDRKSQKFIIYYGGKNHSDFLVDTFKQLYPDLEHSQEKRLDIRCHSLKNKKFI